VKNHLKFSGAIFSALLLTISFPKWNAWILGFFALVPLFFCFLFEKKEKNIVFLSFIFGIIHFSTLLYWLLYTLNKFGHLPKIVSIFLLVLLSSYLALYYVFLFYVNFRLRIFKSPTFVKALFFSLTFVGAEFLRSKLLTGFTWGQLGYILTNFSPLLQSAEIWGIWGLSFIAVFINYYLFFFLYWLFFSSFSSANSKFLINTVPFFILLVSLVLYGMYRETFWKKTVYQEEKSIKVALLQGNIPQEMKEINEIDYSLRVYRNLTLSSLNHRPDIIFFPETSFPFFFPYEKEPTFRLLKFLDEVKTKTEKTKHKPTLIFGTFRLKYKNGSPMVYNSLIVWDGIDFVDLYDKEKLVPFGEYVPLEKFLSFLRRITVGLGIVKPGISKNLIVPLENFNIKITPLICFESAFSEILRKRLRENTQLIFIATNDAWFDKTSAPYQHFQMAIVRAVEARRYTIQVANTGITGIIDPTGRVIKKSSLEREEIIYGEVKPLYKPTLFVNYGNLLGITGSVVLLIFFIFTLFYAKFSNHQD